MPTHRQNEEWDPIYQLQAAACGIFEQRAGRCRPSISKGVLSESDSRGVQTFVDG
ncbi:MAG: hypothetical protein BMS9Abin17_0302 [Acidimicrobiia bacterium]|nr:MAG: hypothetical protein BMS9Abin17_0302 [Acidimicrobiia bacterium]